MRFTGLSSLGTVVLLSACGGYPIDAASNPVAVQLHSGAHCGSQATRREAMWITGEADFHRAYADLFSQWLGAESPEPPSVDFENEAVLVLAMGQRPTAGYHVALAGKPLKIEKGIAVVPIVWEEPAPDSFQAQVLTSPCTMIKLPRMGYGDVRVVDQGGRVRFELPAPEQPETRDRPAFAGS